MKAPRSVLLALACLTVMSAHPGAGSPAPVPAPASAACVDPHAVTTPVTVNYGESGHPEHPRPIILTPLPNGTLSARDGSTHEKLWVYSPPARLLLPEAAGPLGPVEVLRFDTNGDGVIDPAQGDRVWIYFGLQNRGRSYIALDASARNRVSTLWIDDARELPHIGLAWGKPTVARARISDQLQNGESLVVFLPGGASDPAAPPGTFPGAEGNRLYAVDAATGSLLWSAGAEFDDDIPDLPLPEMTYGLASRIVALALDASGFVDRLYASDIGAQLWRVDLTNNAPRAAFATGGRLASLGLASSPSPDSADAREFFSAPDVSLVTPAGAPAYLNLLIGSGNALSIDSMSTHDRLYAVRDFNVFQGMSASEFAARTPLVDSDLPLIDSSADASNLPPQAPGWKRALRPAGEKILAEALTSNGVTMIPSFEPLTSTHLCGEGKNRVYVLREDTGKAARDLNGDHEVNVRDDSTEISQKTVAPAVRITMTRPAGDGSTPGDHSVLDAIGREVRCFAGTEALVQCVEPRAVIRTYWRRESVR